jgi:hypothetical protein
MRLALSGKGFRVLGLDRYCSSIWVQACSRNAKQHMRRACQSVLGADDDGASPIHGHITRAALSSIRFVTEFNGSRLPCGTTPDHTSHVIAEWKLWKEEVHLHGITTEAAIFYEFND